MSYGYAIDEILEKNIIGLDGKYDLNIDHAPVLSIVVENNAGCGTPLAFGMF